MKSSIIKKLRVTIRTKNTLFRFSYKFTRILYALLFIFCSCNNQEIIIEDEDILTIDPRTFKESNLTLSDVADKVDYVVLDNSIPFSRDRSEFRILNNSIYVCIDDIQLLKFDIEGKDPQPIGKFGRGPGEYLFCNYYAVDSLIGRVYIRGKRDAIMVYSPSGEFIDELIPDCEKGQMFHEMEFLNNHLYIAQFIHMGKAQFNWIIVDSLGDIISQKPNFIPSFESGFGQGHGINKYKDRILYWDTYNDTVFTIYPDFSYKATIYFPPGYYRRRMEDIVWSTPQELIEEETKICRTLDVYETNNFWVYRYMYNSIGIAFIDKRTREVLLSFREIKPLTVMVKSWGIENDFDGGPKFQPLEYYTQNDDEYMAGMLDSYQLIEYISSNAFKNSEPKYPEKKEELIQLVNRLEITDNPVIMRIRLNK